MKFGCCVKDPLEALRVHRAGYDFVECSVLSLHPEGRDEDFQEVLHGYDKLFIPVEVCNLFLPRDLRIVGEALDQQRIKDYIPSALKRVKAIGADTIVFGSGYARNVPEGFTRSEAETQLIEFLQFTAEHAEKFGVTVVIEPLNRNESNIINSIAEGVYYAQKAESRFIQVLADFYHMDEEKEPLTEIVKYKDYLKHIHLADTGRHQPGTGRYSYPEFSQCIKKSNYDARLSIEAVWTSFEEDELIRSVQYLKACLMDETLSQKGDLH